MFRDFYATAAQVLPMVVLAFVWESRFLDRIAGQHRVLGRARPGGVLFWTKRRVRVYSVVVAVLIVAGTAAAVLVLAGALADTAVLRGLVTGCVIVALATLLWRISVDVLVATQDRPAPPPDPSD